MDSKVKAAFVEALGGHLPVYISHMRATCYNIVTQPIATFDGQHVGIHGRYLIVDGVQVARFDPIKDMWTRLPSYRDRELVKRIIFTYVDAEQNELPDN